MAAAASESVCFDCWLVFCITRRSLPPSLIPPSSSTTPSPGKTCTKIRGFPEQVLRDILNSRNAPLCGSAIGDAKALFPHYSGLQNKVFHTKSCTPKTGFPQYLRVANSIFPHYSGLQRKVFHANLRVWCVWKKLWNSSGGLRNTLWKHSCRLQKRLWEHLVCGKSCGKTGAVRREGSGKTRASCGKLWKNSGALRTRLGRTCRLKTYLLPMSKTAVNATPFPQLFPHTCPPVVCGKSCGNTRVVL